jgi:hypothetical protein
MYNDPFNITVPTFNTAGLTDAVTAVLAALASKPAARDTTAASSLTKLVENLRALGL